MTRKTEKTEAGEQVLIDGVDPITPAPKTKPLPSQKSCDIGLFDEVGRAQIDIEDIIKESKK